MIWDESMIKYAHQKMCNKFRPWECGKCPLKRFNGCQVGIMINEIKEWARKNISEDRLLAKKEGK